MNAHQAVAHDLGPVDEIEVGQRATVDARALGARQRDLEVVHAQALQRGQEVLDGVDFGVLLPHQRRAALALAQARPVGAHARRTLEVRADEDHAVVGPGRRNAQRGLGPGVESHTFDLGLAADGALAPGHGGGGP